MSAIEQTVFLYDKIYIPAGLVKDTTLLKHWEFPVFDEAMCKVCPNKPNRLNEQCKTCPGYLKTLKLWGQYKGKNNIDYYFVPVGFVNRALDKLGLNSTSTLISDRRCAKAFSNNLQFTGTLKTGEIENGIPTPNQRYLVDEWLKRGYGIIQAPPRTGKTVLGCNIACNLKVRTIIITNQDELLQNFYKTFEDLTNLKQLRQETGREIVKIIDSVDEITNDLDIVLTTYQKFIRKETAKDRIDSLLKGKFGLFITDEVHTAGAMSYAKFLNQLDCKYRLGLSATPNRKDCVEGTTKICTDRGELTMLEIFNRSEKGEKIRVFSKNTETGTIELKPILEFHRNIVDRIREIELLSGDILRVTQDHEFL